MTTTRVRIIADGQIPLALAAEIAGLAESRLQAFIHGARPSAEEREALQRCLGDWDGSNGPKGGGR